MIIGSQPPPAPRPHTLRRSTAVYILVGALGLASVAALYRHAATAEAANEKVLRDQARRSAEQAAEYARIEREAKATSDKAIAEIQKIARDYEYQRDLLDGRRRP